MVIKLNYNIRLLPNEIEQFIIKKLNKNPPQSYAKITPKELDQVKKMTTNRFPNYSDQITENLIKSIRSSYMKNHMINRHQYLIKNSKKILNLYNNGENILNISGQFDLSPLNILREVFTNKYKLKLTKIIINPDLISEYDNKQLNLAIESDDYALVDNSQVQKDSSDFEKQIEQILKNYNIEYLTQEDLIKEQMKTHGQPVNTPDFLIKSNLFINNHKINWIDAKNFYGSNVPFVKNKIKKQTLKYINTWGPGCIIFNLGSNQNLKFTNILFLNFQDITF